jgi:hypothetical protein
MFPSKWWTNNQEEDSVLEDIVKYKCLLQNNIDENDGDSEMYSKSVILNQEY